MKPRPFSAQVASRTRSVAQRAIAVGLLLAAQLPASADPLGPAAPASQADGKQMHEMELRGVEDTIRASDEQRKRIEGDID
ncbi:MAG TPA: hypothetical protein VEK35_01135, partial [Roseiarcus sp.]|nr:hypothetical protein [Roseiarcus sp.]